GGEEHREPRQEAELRFLVVAPQGDVAEAAHAHEDGEDDESGDGQGVVPAQPADDTVLDGTQHVTGALRGDDGDERDAEHDGEGRIEDRGCDTAPPETHAVRPQLLLDSSIALRRRRRFSWWILGMRTHQYPFFSDLMPSPRRHPLWRGAHYGDQNTARRSSRQAEPC